MCVPHLIIHLLFGLRKANHRSLMCSSLFHETQDESFTIQSKHTTLSSELRKHQLVVLPRRKNELGAYVTRSIVLCCEHFLPADFYIPACAHESADSSMNSNGKPRKACLFLVKADAVPSVFFFLPGTLRALSLMERPYEAEKGTGRRRAADSCGPNDEATHYQKLAESRRLQHKHSLCKDSRSSGTGGTMCRPTHGVHVR